jgi:hypothetical protein
LCFTLICVFGAGESVFAQNEVDNIAAVVDSSDNRVNDTASDINTVDNIDNADNDNVDNNNAATSKPKPGKSGKSGKSSKTETSSSDIDIVNTATKQPVDKTASDGTILKLKGLVAAGVDINRKISGKGNITTERNRVGKGELELSAQPVKKVRAELGIEYNVNARVMAADSLWVHTVNPDADIGNSYVTNTGLVKSLALGPYLTIDKLYGQYNIVSNGAIRAGIMKKYFGHEERAGLDERYFLKRSIVSDGLEELGFLNHDLTASYRHDLLNDALRLTGGFSWGVADSLACLQNYSAQYTLNGNTEFVLAGIIRHYADSANPSTTCAATLSFRHDAGFCVSEAELTLGTNPQLWATEYRKTMLAGARLQGQFPISINSKILRRVTPVAEAAAYAADLDRDTVDAQFRAGVTLGFAKNSAFQLRSGFGTIIRTANRSVTLRRRYRFDSEAMVVF